MERAIKRSLRSWAGIIFLSGFFIGWLIRVAIYCEAIHPITNGKAPHSVSGYKNSNKMENKNASEGATIIACQADFRCSLLPKSWTVCAALTHCSILLCVTNNLMSVVEIASKIIYDS